MEDTVKHMRRNSGFYSVVFILSTVSVFVAIAAAAKVSYESALSGTQTQYFVNVGLALNAIGWLFIVLALIMYTVPRKDGPRQTVGGAFWLLVAMALTVAGSALLLTAAVRVDQGAYMLIYQLALAAGIIGIIGGGVLLLHSIYAWKMGRHLQGKRLVRATPGRRSGRKSSTRRSTTRSRY